MRRPALPRSNRRNLGVESCNDCNGTGYVVETLECGECDGFGEVDCPHCGNEMDCDACDGDGEIEEEIECDCWALNRMMGDNFAYLERTAQEPQ